MVDNNKETVFETQQNSCTYELTVILIACTSDMQAQARSSTRMERAVGKKYYSYLRSWKMIVSGRGRVRFFLCVCVCVVFRWSATFSRKVTHPGIHRHYKVNLLGAVTYSMPNLCGYMDYSMPFEGIKANIHM